MFLVVLILSLFSGLANAGWRHFRVWETPAGAIFGFGKRRLAPFSGLAKANADSKHSKTANVD